MIETVKNFKDTNFYEATANFIKKLNIPVNEITTQSIAVNDIFEIPTQSFNDVKNIYAVGMIDDNCFKGYETQFDINKPKKYDGVLIFTVELTIEKPTRKILADISRAFNREYHYTPVIVIFKYGNHISLSNTQRQKYKINKEGEKAGKVTILRDINIDNPHRGHIDILEKMKISSKVNSYESLYTHWQEVFDVSILNKSFYKELSDWYFWTLKENNVSFPNAPKGLEENANTLRHEHNAKNVIRLLTRLLFVWFIKEKGLIPDEIFDEEYIKNNILKEFDPKKAEGLFANSDTKSKYYKGVLQNLFFATLNQEMGKRAFRNQKQHRNITNLMRYEDYFSSPNEFIELLEKVVPFMNGGLFECLDKPHPTLKGRQGGEVIIYEDGFSDRPDNALVVPDYIFFGLENDVDLSTEYGTKGKTNKNKKVKGLINILKSYKFTVAENTPIEEDVALDPELLGKVFENLLASYNPETKTTARKQTGSFYTPREIVSYMVDESLIAYLKTKLEDYEDKEELDKKLHQLLAYDDFNPFADDEDLIKRIINAIDTVKILDPAVGSGAFPMGTLQKMVHLLHKLDPQNKYWFDVQLEKAHKQTDELFKTTDKQIQKEKLQEIHDSFDATINHPDYARKLYLIENTIFGVDIQPIAIQISKLRFFISLVVEQNVLNDKSNFGIRPLPNLESKFVTANTLIGIEQSEENLFDKKDIKELEEKLKNVRHKLFNAKTPRTKSKLRIEDKSLREQISDKLKENGLGNNTAEQLASWDPYDQNESSRFFDMEWMFGIEDGFDIVIGNPPYFNIQSFGANSHKAKLIQDNYPNIWQDKSDILFYFIAKAIELTKNRVVFITSNAFLHSAKAKKLRNFILDNAPIDKIINFEKYMVFDSASITSTVIEFNKIKKDTKCLAYIFKENNYSKDDIITITSNNNNYFNVELKRNDVFELVDSITSALNNKIDNNCTKISNLFKIGKGMETAANNVFLFKEFPIEFPTDFIRKRMSGEIIKKYHIDTIKEYLLYFEDINNFDDLPNSIQNHLIKNKEFLENRATVKNEGRAWWKYSRPMHKNFYHLNKIWCSYRAKENVFCLDDTNEFIGFTNTTVIFDTNDNIDLKYLLALLNSKLLEFRHKSLAKQTGGGIYEYVPNAVEKAPIKEISTQDQRPFINIVDKIIEQKSNDEDTQDLETKLDNMIYELYGLSDDEIDIVEGR